MINWKVSGKKRSWPNFEYYLCICLEGLRKTIKTLSREGRLEFWTRDLQIRSSVNHSTITFVTHHNARFRMFKNVSRALTDNNINRYKWGSRLIQKKNTICRLSTYMVPEVFNAVKTWTGTIFWVKKPCSLAGFHQRHSPGAHGMNL
jgi:hypothetical protein